MKRILYTLLVLGLLTSLNVTGGNIASAVQANQVLRIGYEELPGILDPAWATDDSSSTIVRGLFEGLVRLNQAGLAVPAMAKEWKVSNDGKTYTFTLRSSAKWSNQQQVKASDFEYAWKRVLNPEAGNNKAFKMYAIANAENYHSGKLTDSSKVGIKALNNSTLQVTLNEKTAYFPQLLAENVYLPVNAAVAKEDGNWAYDLKSVITNGPFKLKQWDANKVSLVKNPNYYAAQDINFSEVDFLTPKPGTASLTSAYINNEVDWVVGEEVLDYSSIDSHVARDYYALPLGATYFYQVNVNVAPFNNLKVRQALAMAIERETLQHGTPAYGFIPFGIAGAHRDFRSEIKDKLYFQEDAVLAKKLLKEGLQEEGYKELPSFSIIVNEGSHVQIAKSVIKSWKKNLGIDVTVEPQTWEDLINNRKHKNYTVARAGWRSDFNDPAGMMEFLTSGNVDNDTGWSNKSFDTYIQQARQTVNPQERVKLYAEAEKLLIDQMGIIPLYYYEADVLHKANIKNVYLTYDGSIAFARGNMK